MSRFKIGDKVIVKLNGKVGTIKGRDVHNMPNGRVAIEYIVKTGEGFCNWDSYGKHELEKVVPVKRQKTDHVLVVDAPDGYKVTLVALIKRFDVAKDILTPEGYWDYYVKKGKELLIGYSIYNPNDEYDHDLGVRIATHRAKKRPFCHLTCEFGGEFTKETIDALLKVKGEYIANNLKNFIS